MIPALLPLALLGACAAEAAAPPRPARREAARARWDAGVAAVLKDDRDAARLEWELCLQLDAGNRDCRAGLKLLGRDAAGDEAARRERARRFVREATAKFQQGDQREARRLAMEALAIDPGDNSARAIVRLARTESGDSGLSAPPCGGSDYPTVDPRAASGGGAPAPGCARAAEPLVEDARRRASEHWNRGILMFQKGDYAKARDEWLLCKQYDPDNEDCLVGLQRIEGTFGGAP